MTLRLASQARIFTEPSTLKRSVGTNIVKPTLFLPFIILSILFVACQPASTPPAPTPAPTATQIPTAANSPTAASTPTRTRTDISTATAIPATTSPAQSPTQIATATRLTDNFPSSCGDIPGTQKIGVGYFDFQARTVTFCNADIAAMDVCELRTLEYCHCNSTSGCCQNPGADLSIGDRTSTLHYPSGTTSFQASITPACRRHNSDRVLIIGFQNPLP